VPNQEAADPIVARRLAALVARFPDRFSDDDLAAIGPRIQQSIELGEKLRSVPLTNGNGLFFSPVTKYPGNHDE
jgi:hypothetical protein